MITAMTTARTQASTRRFLSRDRAKDRRMTAEADDQLLEAAFVAPEDPDALPGRGRWAECY